MADGLTTQSATPATIPASSKIATDEDTTNGHVQIIKLAVSTDGSAAVIPAHATNGLGVDIKQAVAIALDAATLSALETITIGTALPAGTNNIGDVDVASLPGTSTGAYATVTIGTTAAVIKAANTGRRSISVQNVHASNILYVGLDSSVTTANGTKLNPGEAIEIGDYYTGAVYGIASAAGTDVRYLEIG